jgi:hypothetical protein
VKPALTAEEWQLKAARRDDTNVGVDDTGTFGADNYVTNGQRDTLFSTDSPPARHAIAALALHGQPFGFTREDVSILRNLATQLPQSELNMATVLGSKTWRTASKPCSRQRNKRAQVGCTPNPTA